MDIPEGIICPECDGSRTFDFLCEICRGDGHTRRGERCYRCGGTGGLSITCPECEGEGVMDEESYEAYLDKCIGNPPYRSDDELYEMAVGNK